MTSAPVSREVRGPRAADSRAASGETTIIITPEGAIHSPAASIDWPSPYPVASGIWSICTGTSIIANMARPTSTDARLVTSTCRFALERRLTRGAGTRSSHRPHSSSTTAEVPNSPSVTGLVQPQSPPLETGSSRATRPAESASAPRRSNDPPERTGDSGTTRSTRRATSVPSAAAAQNSTCQSVFCATAAAAGRPSAPPIPSEELIRAMAEPRRSGGMTSRMMLMPRGMMPMLMPWRARPAIMGARESASAQISDPATRRARQESSMRRLP